MFIVIIIICIIIIILIIIDISGRWGVYNHPDRHFMVIKFCNVPIYRGFQRLGCFPVLFSPSIVVTTLIPNNAL